MGEDVPPERNADDVVFDVLDQEADRFGRNWRDLREATTRARSGLVGATVCEDGDGSRVRLIRVECFFSGLIAVAVFSTGRRAPYGRLSAVEFASRYRVVR